MYCLKLRNNSLVDLPNDGLDTHETLRYLLLENNKLTSLPCEIGNLRHLAALNLENNPLEYPPIEVSSKGLKSILDFLRNDYVKQASERRDKSGGGQERGSEARATNDEYANTNNNNNFYSYYDDSLATEDVWASDTEEEIMRHRTRSGRTISSRSRSSNSQ